MTDIGFDGQVAIITGAGGGLGRQHALELARRGARIVVNDLGGSVSGDGGGVGPAQSVVQEILDLGGEAVADSNSVATAEGGKAIVKTAVDTFGTVDIVVNNAGILRDKSFIKTEFEDLLFFSQKLVAPQLQGMCVVHAKSKFVDYFETRTFSLSLELTRAG